MKVNTSGVNHARALIEKGKVDKDSKWSCKREERKKLKASMFLGKDDSTGKFKYPFGKNGKVYRRGLIAAKQRAAQHGHQNIESVADGLLKNLDDKSDSVDIFLYGTVGMNINAFGVIAALKRAGKKNVNLRINSPGGSVVEGYAIYNYIKSKGVKPKIFVDGMCGSIATVIACSGEVVMPKNALFMIHNPSNLAIGEKKDMLKSAEILDKIEQGIVGIYQEKTGLDAGKIKQMMDEETWLTADEAMSYGFCDKVVGKFDATMDFGVEIDKLFNHVPCNLQRGARMDLMEILKAKAKSLDISVEAKDEGKLLKDVLNTYELKLKSMETASTVSTLESRIGKDFAMLFGKIKGDIAEDTFDAMVEKVENLQKIVDELGDQKSDDVDEPFVGNADDKAVMAKVKEIVDETGMSEAEAIVELAKREPELIASWR